MEILIDIKFNVMDIFIDHDKYNVEKYTIKKLYKMLNNEHPTALPTVLCKYFINHREHYGIPVIFPARNLRRTGFKVLELPQCTVGPS